MGVSWRLVGSLTCSGSHRPLRLRSSRFGQRRVAHRCVVAGASLAAAQSWRKS